MYPGKTVSSEWDFSLFLKINEYQPVKENLDIAKVIWKVYWKIYANKSSPPIARFVKWGTDFNIDYQILYIIIARGKMSE